MFFSLVPMVLLIVIEVFSFDIPDNNILMLMLLDLKITRKKNANSTKLKTIDYTQNFNSLPSFCFLGHQ